LATCRNAKDVIVDYADRAPIVAVAIFLITLLVVLPAISAAALLLEIFTEAIVGQTIRAVVPLSLVTLVVITCPLGFG
jgi:hypothetical protein